MHIVVHKICFVCFSFSNNMLHVPSVLVKHNHPGSKIRKMGGGETKNPRKLGRGGFRVGVRDWRGVLTTCMHLYAHAHTYIYTHMPTHAGIIMPANPSPDPNPIPLPTQVKYEK